MRTILESARAVLDRDPSPALPLSELHRLLARERSGPVPGPATLLERMRARPDLFRVVEPWDGAWRLLVGRDVPYRRRLGASGLELEPWVAAVRAHAGETGGRADLEGRIRAGLHHLGGSLEPGSRVARVRWVAMVRQARRTRARLRAGALRARGRARA